MAHEQEELIRWIVREWQENTKGQSEQVASETLIKMLAAAIDGAWQRGYNACLVEVKAGLPTFKTHRLGVQMAQERQEAREDDHGVAAGQA